MLCCREGNGCNMLSLMGSGPPVSFLLCICWAHAEYQLVCTNLNCDAGDAMSQKVVNVVGNSENVLELQQVCLVVGIFKLITEVNKVIVIQSGAVELGTKTLISN
jgi:hypothetical protein